MYALVVIYGILNRLLSVSDCIKQKREQIHIVVGGPEVSYEYQDLLNKGIDAISIGEGEESRMGIYRHVIR